MDENNGKQSMGSLRCGARDCLSGAIRRMVGRRSFGFSKSGVLSWDGSALVRVLYLEKLLYQKA